MARFALVLLVVLGAALLAALGRACSYAPPSCADLPEMELLLGPSGHRCAKLTRDPDNGQIKLTWRWCEHADWEVVLSEHVTDVVVRTDYDWRAAPEAPSTPLEALTTKGLMLRWIVRCSSSHFYSVDSSIMRENRHRLGKYECLDECLIR